MPPFYIIILWKNQEIINKILLNLVILFAYFMKSCIFFIFCQQVKVVCMTKWFGKIRRILINFKHILWLPLLVYVCSSY